MKQAPQTSEGCASYVPSTYVILSLCPYMSLCLYVLVLSHACIPHKANV